MTEKLSQIERNKKGLRQNTMWNPRLDPGTEKKRMLLGKLVLFLQPLRKSKLILKEKVKENEVYGF